MKPTKLPSGKWRVRLQLESVDGKRKWKSFTGDTKKQALMMAGAYIEMPKEPTGKTLGEIVKAYIDLKKPVLSPTTQRTYESAIQYFDIIDFGKEIAGKLTSQKAQAWVSALAIQLSPKTVRNTWFLATAALAMFEPDMTLRVTLPQKKPSKLYTPSSADVTAVINWCRENDEELLRAVLLSSCCSLRRGEISALDASDIDFDRRMISVTKAKVKSPVGTWVIKQPKTDGSVRVVPAPPQVMDVLPRSGPVISICPDQITNRFVRALDDIGLPHFRFHDLRHYFATILAYRGVPMRIIQDMGGWESDFVLKRVYTGVIDEEKRKQQERIATLFDGEIFKV